MNLFTSLYLNFLLFHITHTVQSVHHRQTILKLIKFGFLLWSPPRDTQIPHALAAANQGLCLKKKMQLFLQFQINPHFWHDLQIISSSSCQIKVWRIIYFTMKLRILYALLILSSSKFDYNQSNIHVVQWLRETGSWVSMSLASLIEYSVWVFGQHAASEAPLCS